MLDNAGMAAVQSEAHADVLLLKPEDRVRAKTASATSRNATTDPDSDNLVGLFEGARRPEGALPAIDEGAMRELVRHMVREELQSSFGERLTRQIRGLVRREVLRLVGARTAD